MNPLQPTCGGSVDAFVAKFNASGSALVYSTYLGGSGDDYGLGIALDSSGNAYVTGYTVSTNFPTMNPLQRDQWWRRRRLCGASSTPQDQLWFTPLISAAAGMDDGFGIAVDSSGNAYVTGPTTSTDFPTMNPLQPTVWWQRQRRLRGRDQRLRIGFGLLHLSWWQRG